MGPRRRRTGLLHRLKKIARAGTRAMTKGRTNDVDTLERSATRVNGHERISSEPLRRLQAAAAARAGTVGVVSRDRSLRDLLRASAASDLRSRPQRQELGRTVGRKAEVGAEGESVIGG